MKTDNEGFLQPYIKTSLCIECGVCEKVCPVLHPFEERTPIEVYAAKTEDEIRLHSSSGGIFPLLAEYIINQGGVVWGVVWDLSNEYPVAKHKCISTINELNQVKGSKYVQSELGYSYNEIKNQLKKNIKVLFSGTPCQVAGLKHYLHKEYENLFCVEVICHATPSPKVFKSYIKEISKKYIINNTEITNINFRAKQSEGFSWRNYGFVVSGNSSSNDNKRESVLFSSNKNKNPYIRAFLSELCNRNSCHNCQARNLRSGSDITIGDFWKVKEYLPLLDDDKGTSLVLINSNKGRLLYDSIKLKLSNNVITTYDVAIDSTGALIESPIAHPKRNVFFDVYEKKGIEKTVNKLLKPPFQKIVWNFFLDIQYKIKHFFY